MCNMIALRTAKYICTAENDRHACSEICYKHSPSRRWYWSIRKRSATLKLYEFNLISPCKGLRK